MTKKAGFVIAACLMTLLLAACDRIKIGDITSDPGRFNGKEVTVGGRVTDLSVGALSMGFYQIEDGTGKLYVISESHGAPTKGTQVAVKGKILPTFTFLGKNYATVLRESGRKSAN